MNNVSSSLNQSSSRLNQTSLILSKIVPGKNGEPDSKTSTFINYQSPASIRPYTNSELRRITNLGPLPPMPDLKDYMVNRAVIEKENSDEENEEPASENSGDSPREHHTHFSSKQEADADDQEAQRKEAQKERIPVVEISSTHRNDGKLYPKLNRKGYFCEPRIEELKTWTAEQLSKCNNFTVHHQKHGSVEFPGQSDIRSLDLDFRRGCRLF